MIRFNFKYIIIAAAAIAIMLGIYFMGRSSKGNEVTDLQNILRIEQQKTKVWQDEAGHWRNKSESAEIRTNDALQYIAQHDTRFENLSKEFQGLKNNLKNLQYAGFTGFTSEYDFAPKTKDTLVVFHHDTTLAKSFSYIDSLGWYTAKGLILPNGEVPYLSLQTKDSLVTVLSKHKKLFKTATFTQEVKSFNPHTKVVYNQSVIVNKPKKFLGIF